VYLFSFIKFILIAARRDIKLPIVYLCLGVINGLFFLFYGIYDQYNHGYNLDRFIKIVIISIAICITTFLVLQIFIPLIIRYQKIK